MNHQPSTAIGIDIGGTKIAGGVVSLPTGTLIASHRIPTLPARGGEAVLYDTEQLIERLTLEAHEAGLTIDAIGIGLCELVSPTGQILSNSCFDWTRLPVLERLSTRAPVVLEADVRAAAFAEARLGAGQSFQQFLYITVGTGIASCLVLEGRPFKGARGATGTLASSPLGIVCDRCGHVHQTTLEQIASGPALADRFNRLSQGSIATGADVLAAAGRDELALEVIQSAAEALGAHVGLLVNVLDPEAVIVGGGLGSSTGLYWEYFLESARRHIWSSVHRGLPILQAGLGADSGVVGAALLGAVDLPSSTLVAQTASSRASHHGSN